MATARTGLRTEKPAVNINHLFPLFLCHPFEDLQKLPERQIGNLAAPEPLHSFEVESLEAKDIKLFGETMG